MLQKIQKIRTYKIPRLTMEDEPEQNLWYPIVRPCRPSDT